VGSATSIPRFGPPARYRRGSWYAPSSFTGLEARSKSDDCLSKLIWTCINRFPIWRKCGPVGLYVTTIEKQLTFHWALMMLCNETLFLALHFCLYLEMKTDLTFCFLLSFDDVVQQNSLFSYSLLSIPWDGNWLDILFFTELWWRCATKLGIQTFSTRRTSDHKQSTHENTCKGSCRFYHDICFICILRLHTLLPYKKRDKTRSTHLLYSVSCKVRRIKHIGIRLN
jgi:hypothetical protein